MGHIFARMSVFARHLIGTVLTVSARTEGRTMYDELVALLRKEDKDA